MRYVVLLVAMLGLLTSSVKAQDFVSRDGTGSIELENRFGFSGTEGMSTFGWAPVLGGRYRFAEKFDVALRLPFAFGSISPDMGDGASSFRIANPYVEGSYVLKSDDWQLLLGVGVALPVASLPDVSGLEDFAAVVAAASAFSLANGALGLMDSWLFAPETLTITLPTHFFWSKDALRLRGDGALALAIPTADGADTTFLLQLAGSAGYAFGDFEAGGRLSLVSDFDETTQVAVAPYFRGNFGSFYTLAALNLNLSKPAGFSFDDGRILGLQVNFGYQL